MKNDILQNHGKAVLTSIPPNWRVVVDLDAIWTQHVCVSESVEDLRDIKTKFLERLNKFNPSQVVLARESSGVPLRKRIEQEKRDGDQFPPNSIDEFKSQWNGNSRAYTCIAQVAGLELTPRAISARLRKNREVRALLRDDFLTSLCAMHRKTKCPWPLIVHGDTLVDGDVEREVEGYNPGEGEFKFGRYLDGTPTVFVTTDSDAIAIILCGLPSDAPFGTYILSVGNIFDMGALRAEFADRADLDAWLLGWMMAGNDYVCNPPRLGLTSIERAAALYGQRLLRDAIFYKGKEAVLDEDRVLRYWFVLRSVPWLVSKRDTKSVQGEAFDEMLRGSDAPDSILKNAVKRIGESKFEKFLEGHAPIAANLAWVVHYFMGAGQIEPRE